MELIEIQKLVYEEYKRNGYLKMWTERNSQKQKKSDLAELGLFLTEIVEAQEEIRNKNTDLFKLGFECADIIIRTLNFMSRKGLNADFYILKKHERNINRDKLHGRDI